MPGFLYADDIVLCGKLEGDLREMLKCFVEVCRNVLLKCVGKKGVKVNEVKRKVIVLGGEEEPECDVYVDGM